MPPSNIIVVEYDNTDAKVIHRTFSAKGRENILILKDGAAASRYFQECTDIPKLIILDMNLPNHEGFNLLKEIRLKDSLSEVPIVVFSSSDQQEDISASYKLGANSYVIKPSTHEKFLLALERIYFFWFKTAQMPYN